MCSITRAVLAKVYFSVIGEIENATKKPLKLIPGDTFAGVTTLNSRPNVARQLVKFAVRFVRRTTRA